MSEIRYDLLHDEYVIVAPERLHRPMEYSCTPLLPAKRKCPFCPGNEDLTPREIFALRDEKGWKTRVFPNRYTALRIEEPFEAVSEGVQEGWRGFGAHEIVVDTPRHLQTLSQIRLDEIVAWLTTLRARVQDLRNDKRLVQIEIFKNHGARAGATLEHPHTQLIAMPLLSQKRLHLLRHHHGYYARHGRTILHDIVDTITTKLRTTENFVTFVPYAPAFAFETIVASRHSSSLAKLDDPAIEELAAHLTALFGAYDKTLGNCGCNILFYLSPLNQNFEIEEIFASIDSFYRFYIRITPRIYTLGGFELQTGSAINPVDPTQAYKLLGEHYA